YKAQAKRGRSPAVLQQLVPEVIDKADRVGRQGGQAVAEWKGAIERASGPSCARQAPSHAFVGYGGDGRDRGQGGPRKCEVRRQKQLCDRSCRGWCRVEPDIGPEIAN